MYKTKCDVAIQGKRTLFTCSIQFDTHILTQLICDRNGLLNMHLLNTNNAYFWKILYYYHYHTPLNEEIGLRILHSKYDRNCFMG